MRGRQMTAAPDTKISPAQRPGRAVQSARSDAAITAPVPPGPPFSPQTTKAPTDSNATSLTTASTAMAETMPSCRSPASSLRVPKRMVKTARPTATQNASPFSSDARVPGAAKTPKLSVTDCSCSAI